MRPSLRVLLAPGVLGVFLAVPALAAPLQRVFVSAVSGSDTNPCSRILPCRTFGQALTTVAAGGEIVVVDSGGYGPVTITKAVTIVAPVGIYAGISVLSGDGIDINAGATDVVTLRGLSINGLGGATGIYPSTVGVLHVANCEISGFSNWGIIFQLPSQLDVADSVIRESGRAIQATGTGAGTPAVVSIHNCRLENNSSGGLYTFEYVTASVSDSTFTGNNYAVVEASGTGTTSSVTLEHCLIANNTYGVLDSNPGAGIVRVSNSDVTNNGTAFSQFAPHVIESYGNNRTRGNTNPNSGSVTLVSTN